MTAEPMQLARPVFFVGFMGAGKTSVARRLARTCGISSVDMDTYLERREGKRVKEVVDGKKVTVYDEVEKTIKKDKASRLAARRQILAATYVPTVVPTQAAGKKKNTKKVDLAAKLFDEYGPKYASRNGGYTRIVKVGLRKGDAAMEVLLELV